ncbi:MAG TPA: hypothetical protein VE954_31330 [Oligoflexus sp.]|uniref:hypothetical protein n=1 Tax=Oligoflexus sp. TaxID=1971216 RepID=UPI002D325595|nr:hypothetical protein [Oligoflexus sp.]HYX37617.1 hypothetical protein [Oligoflexus sp.]
MGSRLLPAALLLTTGPLSAAPIRNLNTIEYEYRDQQLASRNPKLKRPDHLNIWGGRSLFLYEQAKLNAQAEIGATTGNSGTTSFTALQARSAATWREAHSSDTLEAGWIRSHGADDTQRPLEETVLEIGAPFTGTRAAYRHDRQLNAMNSVAAAAGISRNIDGTTDLESREVAASWSNLINRSWTNTLSLIRGTQKVRNGLSADTWEIKNDDLWVLNNDWSMQTTVGGLQQTIEEEKKTSFIMGAAFSYVMRRANPEDKKDKAQPIAQDMIRRPDLDRIENVRTQSQFRAGWDRNLDQRRKGDAQFLSDQFFVQGLWAIDTEQNLQIDLQRSQSIDKTVPGAAGLIRDLANLDYRWTTGVGPSTAGILGSFGLGITQETVKQNPQRFDRQLLRVSYAVTF